MPERLRRVNEFAIVASQALEVAVAKITVTPVEIEGETGFSVVASGEAGVPTVEFDTVTNTGTIANGLDGLGYDHELTVSGREVIELAKDIGEEGKGVRFEFHAEEAEHPANWGVFSFDPESPKCLHWVASIAVPSTEKPAE